MKFLEVIINAIEAVFEFPFSIKDPLSGKIIPSVLEGLKHDQNGYKLSSLIACDTKASIYSAFGTSTGTLYVAKVFNDMEHYQREATCGEALAIGGVHKHVLIPHEFIQTPEHGVVIYPYIRGRSLSDYVSRTKILPAGEATAITCQVLDGLDFMHKHGVIHRDVKLENVMLHIRNPELDFITGDSIYPKQGHVEAVLHDYDVSYHASIRGLDAQKTFGTPSYMAPEVWRGDRCDPRSDVYAIGVMFSRLLTGGFPFVTDRTTVSLEMQHFMTPPPTILTNDLGISCQLTEIIHKSMAKNPEYRYQSAAEMQDHLSDVFGLE